MKKTFVLTLLGVCCCGFALNLIAQPPQEGRDQEGGRPGFGGGPGGFGGGPGGFGGGPGGFGGGPGGFGGGPGGFGGGPGGFGGGPGGFGGGPRGAREELALVKEYDLDKNGWLNKEERAQARAEAKQNAGARGGPGGGGRGPGGPGGGNRGKAKPGRQLAPSQVENFANAELYDPTVLRTLFFEFENSDWEKELEDFHGTDVDVAAQLTVDGKTLENVGLRFRGMSSYGMVPSGFKRSFNVSIDLADKEQRLYGFKTLNLLNSSGDPSYLSTILYSHVASQYIPVPKANHVRVVINGECWGIYVNVQQFNKDFLAEHFESTKGTRWKVSGNPNADGGLRYLGEELEPYKQRFEMKSNDGKKAWKSLILLCKTLNETPTEELEEALEPMLDIDQAIRFLALDVALVNSDGYWTRASDYSLFLDKDKRFHLIPHDMNEAFMLAQHGGPGGGPGGPGGPGGFGPPPGLFGMPFDFFGGGPPNASGTDNNQGRNFQQRGGQRDGRDANRRGRRRGPGGQGGPGGFGGGPGGFGGGPGGRGPGGPGGRGPGGPGGRGPGGGPGHGSYDLDPLVSIDNDRMPLRSRLLAVPSLRAKYLKTVREIAEKSLTWNSVRKLVHTQAKLIEADVAADTRKLSTLDAFRAATTVSNSNDAESASLRDFFTKRREYLMNYRESNRQ